MNVFAFHPLKILLESLGIEPTILCSAAECYRHKPSNLWHWHLPLFPYWMKHRFEKSNNVDTGASTFVCSSWFRNTMPEPPQPLFPMPVTSPAFQWAALHSCISRADCQRHQLLALPLILEGGRFQAQCARSFCWLHVSMVNWRVISQLTSREAWLKAPDAHNCVHELGKAVYRIVHVPYHCSKLGVAQINKKTANGEKYSHGCTKKDESLFISDSGENICYHKNNNDARYV